VDPHFITVFDISQKHADWQMLSVPLIFCLGGIGAAVWGLWTRRGFKFFALPLFFAFMGGFLIFVEYRTTTFGLVEQTQKLRRGNVRTIEGPVTEFVPMPYAGHSYERFTVHGVSFSYSDFETQPCFNQSRSHGGPIAEGLWVRISYEGNCIMRIEVWQPGK
jgi:hypothetical protein